MNQQPVKSTYQFALALSVLLVAVILRCWNITQSFWWDEIWSTMRYANAPSVWSVMSNLGYYFNNHILYSLMARESLRLFGESEVSARLPALIMGILSIVVAYQFFRKYLGEYCAIICAFLLAISAFHIDHSSEARGYSGLALFTLLSSHYFLKALSINTIKQWSLYALYTVLGCYIQVFMIAVCIAQLLFLIIVFIGKKSEFLNQYIAPNAYRNFCTALFCAAIATLLLYAPILPSFLANMGKVRLVNVSRLPFLMNLLNTMLPGIQTLTGAIVYGITGCWGLYGILKKDSLLGMYILTIIFLPLIVYLALNPMFMFERYFIFALPFVLLVVSSGIIVLSQYPPERYKTGFVFLCVLVVCYMQISSVKTMLTQYRQDYRDAVQFVEHNITDANTDLVFSIGYAGDHFRYYARTIPIYIPESLADLNKLSAGKKRVWCLLTAWLPSIRPAYEDRTLYDEKTGQTEIYDYVKTYFKREKVFPSRYPVEVYCYE